MISAGDFFDSGDVLWTKPAAAPSLLEMPRSALIFLYGAAVFLLAVGTSACTTYRESQPGRTATEQLLFSTAVERVCDKLALQLPWGSKVYVDASFVEGADSKYLVASLRDRILLHGGRLVAARDRADIVFEPRIGALSIDRKETLLGIPSIPLPIPLAGEFQLPELALFKRERRQGVVKLALASYDAKTGALRRSVKPVYGYAERTDWVVLLLVGWQTNDLMPDPENDDWIGEGTLEAFPPDP